MTGKVPKNAKWATCHFGFGPWAGETDDNSSCVLPSNEISNKSYLRMYLWWSLCTLYLHCTSGGVYVPCIYTVPLVECMYLVFTRMPGESYRKRLRFLVYSYCVFRTLINSLVY